MKDDSIVLDKHVLTEEVFRMVQDGSVIHVMPAKYYPEWNHREPVHIALCDENDCFLDWLA